jgi:hypothetical protein
MLRVAAAAILASALGAGCHRGRPAKARAPIGSPCAADAVCGSGAAFHCASDHPGGYCEAVCRSDGDCPTGAVCVGGGVLANGACHHACAAAGDCRASEGYQCIRGESDASHDYCDPPGRSELARRLKGGEWRW